MELTTVTDQYFETFLFWVHNVLMAYHIYHLVKRSLVCL